MVALSVRLKSNLNTMQQITADPMDIAAINMYAYFFEGERFLFTLSWKLTLQTKGAC